jgi:Putative rhamnosyl transferase
LARIHGHVRFPFLGRSDARTTHATDALEDRAAALYAPLRMAQRFHLFEHICLPALRAQTHKDFRITLLTSPQMPEADRARLETLVATLPQGRVVYSDADNVLAALEPILTEATESEPGITYHFRLDDDDALCKTAIETMDRYCDSALPGEILSFPRGFYLAKQDKDVRLVRKFEDYIAIGLGVFAAPGTVRNPYAGAHRKMYKRIPSRIEPRLPAYIHVAHMASDTAGNAEHKLQAAIRQDPEFADNQQEIARLLRQHFPFTYRQLRNIMAAIPEKLPLASGKASG